MTAPGFSSGHGDKHFSACFCSDAGSIQSHWRSLLYFFTYLVMVYVATRRFVYFGGGILAMIVASLLGYRLFDHVQARVQAWSNPLAVIDGAGYQVCQSLFAIGTGGWFGLGLGQGHAGKIPVVTKDFVFAAISEELGESLHCV